MDNPTTNTPQNVTLNTAKNTVPITVQELMKVAKLLGPAPVVRVEVGSKLWKQLKRTAHKMSPSKGLNQLRMGGLYGAPTILNKTLKPHQYRIVRQADKS